jgi:N-acetylglucosaminyldiphosphoundecaprenol N-acetyl-beta-D-mannosaminyltransferase
VPKQESEDRAANPAPALAAEVIEVLGLPIALTNYRQTVDWIDAAVAADSRSYICVAPVHLVMLVQDDPELKAAVLGADFVVPDGQPLVWSVTALGGKGASRVYGPDLMIESCRRAGENGTKIYLFGGRDEDALALLRSKLLDRFPKLQIVGSQAPPFRTATDAEEDEAIEKINSSGAEIVWVGTGQPRQELWMAKMRSRLKPPVLVGVGAAFDFHAELVPQAPTILQEAGLEWAFRLWQEPRRLWRRYLIYNPRFISQFLKQLRAQRSSTQR